MADKSDDCRDVVRCRQELSRGWGCVFGSRCLFIRLYVWLERFKNW